MYTLLILLVLIISVLIILVVLMQAPKGGGLAGTFGGVGEMGSMFGVRRTADFLSKATWYLGGALAVLCLLINLAFLPDSSQNKMRESATQQRLSRTVPKTPYVPPPVQQQTPNQQQNQQQK